MREILLSHESGSEKGNSLIRNIFISRFKNSILNKMEDAAILEKINRPVFTTDSFTVKPIFFPGGDIGKLAIAGTCNDLAVRCSKPLYLSAAFMIEEGFSIDHLEKIVDSMLEECVKNQVQIVCGDTKILPKGSLDGIFINTSGIGDLIKDHPGSEGINEGHSLIVSGPIGQHAAVILMKKRGLDFKSDLMSDCRSLWPDIEYLLKNNVSVISMRDITRGGLSGILHEWALSSSTNITINEKEIPVREEVAGFSTLTGIDYYHLACEGTFLLAVPADEASDVLSLMRKKEGMMQASIIGDAVRSENRKHNVYLLTETGVRRNLEMPSGEHLPRIC